MQVPTAEQKLRWIKPEVPTEWERRCAAALQPGVYEIGVQRTNDILDEAMQVFERCCRTSFGVTGDSMVAMFTAQGDLANASCGTYLHAIIQPIIIKYILARYGKSPGIHDGDIWYANDPLYGGIHNPDRVALMPVFHDGQLLAWVSAATHTSETGAIEPGGMPPSARTRFDEGLNLPPIKIGENFAIREDFLEMYGAFALRAPAMVLTDLRARCTTADRARVRLLEVVRKEGVEYVVGLLSRMVSEAEIGARRKIHSWPDGKYRCVNFNDTIGTSPGLNRTFLTLIKEGDRIVLDFTGTSPETPTSYNLHPQAAVGHVAQFVFEYLFPDLPVSNATFAPIDFVFPPGSFLMPDALAATSNSTQIGPNVIGLPFNCVGKMLFATGEWKQVTACKALAGNGHVLAGRTQWGMPFTDVLAFQLNTRGQGGRTTLDGMNACGMLYCPTGRSPDVEFTENEFPLLIPLSSHWRDSCGHGKYRGGVGTVQVLVAYERPEVYFLCTGPGSKLQNAQPLFGGYAPPTTPGIAIRGSDILERLSKESTALRMDLHELLKSEAIGGQWQFTFRVKSTVRHQSGDVINFAFTVGGAGYGDPLDRDPHLVAKDLEDDLISSWTGREIYRVAYDSSTQKVDERKTIQLREEERQTRLRRGKPYAEFVKEWSKRKPPEEALSWYGTWPEARPTAPAQRM